MLSRSLGKLLRGNATPLQLVLACVLGALIGFVPGAKDHPGQLAVIVLLLIVLNANIGLALLVSAVAKLASLALMPVSFKLGHWLIEGPGRAAVAWAVEAPVLALMDLDVYAVTGGMVMALGIGLVLGLVLVTLVTGVRRKFANLEEGSERYKALMSKGWVRFLVWLLLGKGHGKLTYAQVLARRSLNPIRPVGAVLVGLLVAVVWFAPALLGSTLLAAAAKSGLETAHGATVEVGAVSLDLAEGRLAIDGLALADPEALDKDAFRAMRVEADGSMGDLLRGRLSLDKLLIIDGLQGAPRSERGELVGERRPASQAPAAGEAEQGIDSGTIREYFEDAGKLEQRLAQVREWLETLSDEGEGDPDQVGAVPGETLAQRLAREVELLGYGRVRAKGLRSDAPALLIRELLAEGVATVGLGDELVDVKGSFLSTDPALVKEPAQLSVRSRAGTLNLQLGLGGQEAQPADNVVRFQLRGLSGDTVGAMLAKGKLSGGTLDVDLDGTWDGGRVGMLDLPLNVTLRGVIVDIVGGPRQVDELVLPFGIRGPLDNPRISFEGDALTDALMASAKAELQGHVDDAKAKLDDAKSQAEAEVAAQQAAVAAKQAELAAKQKEAEDKAKAALEAEKKKAKDKLGGALGGLLGGDDDG